MKSTGLAFSRTIRPPREGQPQREMLWERKTVRFVGGRGGVLDGAPMGLWMGLGVLRGVGVRMVRGMVRMLVLWRECVVNEGSGEYQAAGLVA